MILTNTSQRMYNRMIRISLSKYLEKRNRYGKISTLSTNLFPQKIHSTKVVGTMITVLTHIHQTYRHNRVRMTMPAWSKACAEEVLAMGKYLNLRLFLLYIFT